jgi:prepilin-type N-terminal cleavage/methylation domain-containing protein
MPNYSPNSNPDQTLRTSALRQVVGFTLIELLVVMAIISLLSAAILVALTELQATSKVRRCQQQIEKINQLIVHRWDELLHKPLPRFSYTLTASGLEARQRELNLKLLTARRELLRLELPERFDDFLIPPAFFDRFPPTTNTFNDRLKQVNIVEARKLHQGAECLYLILSVMQDRDSSALDFFFPSEIGDTDNDGMLEILDGFNQPIGFLRWAPGYSYQLGIDPIRTQSRFSDIQDRNPVDSPDATDMGSLDDRLDSSNPTDHPFNLFPLIMSKGRDGKFGMYFGNQTIANQALLNDPFTPPNHGKPIDDTILDNISNHQIEVNP